MPVLECPDAAVRARACLRARGRAVRHRDPGTTDGGAPGRVGDVDGRGCGRLRWSRCSDGGFEDLAGVPGEEAERRCGPARCDGRERPRSRRSVRQRGRRGTSCSSRLVRGRRRSRSRWCCPGVGEARRYGRRRWTGLRVHGGECHGHPGGRSRRPGGRSRRRSLERAPGEVLDGGLPLSRTPVRRQTHHWVNRCHWSGSTTSASTTTTYALHRSTSAAALSEEIPQCVEEGVPDVLVVERHPDAAGAVVDHEDEAKNKLCRRYVQPWRHCTLFRFPTPVIAGITNGSGVWRTPLLSRTAPGLLLAER